MIMVVPIHVDNTHGGVCFAGGASIPHSRLAQSLYALKEMAVHLLDLQDPTMQPSSSFCQQRLEFPRSLPS